MALNSGDYIGPYEILSPLGSGGMGEVYKAKDPRLGREVAIKVLPAHLAEMSDALDRFEREARALAVLSHPNILTIHDVGKEGSVCYTVTELLEGETLRSRLDNETLSPETILEIAIAVTEGLEAAHSRGIVHRDVKPENIFLTTDNRVKILDFGLVHWEESIPAGDVTNLPTGPQVTRIGTVMGTVHYMSPEQVRGLAADVRTDIFSLGCVLYEMAAGRRPFQEGSNVETMFAILKNDPHDITLTPFTVPAELERVIRSCLEKDPENRFQSAHDLNLALKLLRAGSSVQTSIPVVKKQKRTSRKIDSLAVLPFTRTGDDPDSDYLVDGITEAIINSLSQVPRFRVMARSTVFRYKGRDVDPRVVGRDLNVRAVLTGRIQEREESLNVQVELVNVSDGAQLWGQQFQQSFSNLQAIEEEIARQISDTLQLQLIPARRKLLARRYTQNSVAYQLYLRGRFQWNKRTQQGMMSAIEYFDRAIEEDPSFALAYAGLADCYSVMSGFSMIPPTEAYPKAKIDALKAIELDPELPEAWTSLATIQDRRDWDWAAAEQSFRKAIRLNPGYVTAHHWYAVFLVTQGRSEEGEREMAKALELDPLSVVVHWTSGMLLSYARRYEDAIATYRTALDLDPEFHRARYDLALALYLSSRNHEATEEFRNWMNAAKESQSVALTIYALAAMGEHQKARALLQQSNSGGSYISNFSRAVIGLELGDKKAALDWLKKSFEAHEEAIVSLRVNPRLDRLRDEPEFQEILKRVNFGK